MTISIVLFDFGGVVAEEGFRDGLHEIARENGIRPDDFFSAADGSIGDSGYLTGKANESAFWELLRSRTGIAGSDHDLRSRIIQGFIPRPGVIACVDLLRAGGFPVFLLTDQTNWLDEINASSGILAHFNGVYNSYRTHMSKRHADTFDAICRIAGVRTDEALFIDDNEGHVRRAAGRGLNTILYTGYDEFCRELELLTGIRCGS